ncbi:Hypothetical protein, putative [Bodo saltans]|uniref:GPI-anchored surface protein n=1 Tax=Bodo saltans TaxID=75058 RepID=A0A0S4J3H7_BODSA|nr:Hypothetical protein, putative [Bodo saltans]|eukprot:CUG32438.1 Hypothetical protein, putative [Bodo saltans]
MWETRLFLPTLLSVSLATHAGDLLPVSVLLGSLGSQEQGEEELSSSSVATALRDLVDDLQSDPAEERSDLYVVLPQRSGELMRRVGLKLRNMKKKVEVKVATDFVMFGDHHQRCEGGDVAATTGPSPATIVAGLWKKFDTKLDHGLGKPKKVAAFLQDTNSELARDAADQLVAARRLMKTQQQDDDDDCDVRRGDDVSPFDRFPKFPLPLVVVAKSRRQSSATITLSSTRRQVLIAVEETDVQLSTAQASVQLRSWAVESEDKALIERAGRHWATWVQSRGIASDSTSSDCSSSLSNPPPQDQGGVLSYPEVVSTFYLSQRMHAAEETGSSRL